MTKPMITFAPNRSSAARRPHGVALLLVLTVVAVASMLSWAMLSGAALRSQIDVNAADSIEAAYLADSGISYALYYLRYPQKVPAGVTMRADVYTEPSAMNSHYPGETGVRLWSDARGTVDIAVTNTGAGRFKIRSTARVPRSDKSPTASDAEDVRRTVEVDAELLYDTYHITTAGGFNGGFIVPGQLRIDGPVMARGTVSGATSNITNSPPITPTGTNVVPTYDEMTLVQSTAIASTAVSTIATDRTYVYNGQTYVAELAPATVTGTLQTTRPTLNPCNVWYADRDTTLSGTLLNPVTLNGTLVIRAPRKLTITGPVNVGPASGMPGTAGMPAIIAGAVLEMRTPTLALVPTSLTTTGLVWVGDKISVTGAGASGSLTVDGALLMGSTTPTITGTSLPQIRVTYKDAMTNIPSLSTVQTICGISVLRWNANG